MALTAALPAIAVGAVALTSAAVVGPAVLSAAPPVAIAAAPAAGDRLPSPSLEDFKQTNAKYFEEYQGRAVLIEFFEHW